MHHTVNNHAILNDFYVKSYKIIRKYSDTALVVFNELYAKVTYWHVVFCISLLNTDALTFYFWLAVGCTHPHTQCHTHALFHALSLSPTISISLSHTHTHTLLSLSLTHTRTLYFGSLSSNMPLGTKKWGNLCTSTLSWTGTCINFNSRSTVRTNTLQPRDSGNSQ